MRQILRLILAFAPSCTGPVFLVKSTPHVDEIDVYQENAFYICRLHKSNQQEKEDKFKAERLKFIDADRSLEEMLDGLLQFCGVVALDDENFYYVVGCSVINPSNNKKLKRFHIFQLKLTDTDTWHWTCLSKQAFDNMNDKELDLLDELITINSELIYFCVVNQQICFLHFDRRNQHSTPSKHC
uniref:Uncharacterized protein n=1 Tax=Ditylenchus dipsaci TaxID=166011 RepID=A0A915DM90_9BILA